MERAKAADELMWLDFETRMRHLMKNMVSPALRLSVEDREANIEIELNVSKVTKRVDLLEQAVYMSRNESEKGRTIFAVYNDKISDMQQQLTNETLKLHDTQAEFKTEIDSRLFNQD